ncbi:MAG: hypothetical protein H0V67_02980 [Geodermatophilaceae bacterium]|nr:hypothetical protein [Geodermatophilaceae bacterium]
MTDVFGTAGAGLGRMPIRRSQINSDLVLDIVAEAAPELESATLRIRVLDRLGSDPLLSIEEDERRVRIDVAELARSMEIAHVTGSRRGVRAAFASWIGHRPVTDAQADATGLAVCGWADPGCTTIGWQVVVRRGNVVAVWKPSAAVAPTAIAVTRTQAQVRSLSVRVDMHVAGEAVVWTCTAAPALSTAALVSPERMLLRLSRRALPTDDLLVVVSPPNPFVCARGPVAERLAEESNEAHVTLAWPSVEALGWS